MRLCASSPYTRDMAFHPSISCATRPSPPAPASTRQEEVAVREGGQFEMGQVGMDGRSKSSVVYGFASCRRTRQVDPRHRDRG